MSQEQKIKPSKYKSIPSQAVYLNKRRVSQVQAVDCGGMNIVVLPGVYKTSGDSELMIESVQISPNQSFLEVGCGSGVISLALAKRADHGVGVDISELAVKNSQQNAKRLGVSNVTFLKSDVFKNVTGRFEVIVCNPPYTKHAAKDAVERMFWDPNDTMKRRFFKEVKDYLKPNGRLYFGWADFADIDVSLPYQLAKQNGFELVNTFDRPHDNVFTFYVLEFKAGS